MAATVWDASQHSHIMARRGILYATLCYLIWGFMPVYWKLLGRVPALEILSHRIVWALVFNVIVLAALGRWAWVRRVLADRKTLLIMTASTITISINWLVYIWAVNAGHIVDSSLGYFINPLVNVALGVAFFGERMRPGQWLAIALAAAGVIYLTLSSGALPWISLTLAFSFGIYGAMRKVARLESLEGLTVETTLVALPALGFLGWRASTGEGAFVAGGSTLSALLIVAGALTAVPLLLFASGARRIPLSTLGMLQYLAPTIQFVLGALVYHEPFDSHRLLGFAAVWLALLVYAGESVLRQRRAALLPA